MIDALLNEHYLPENELGQGGMGIVYRASPTNAPPIRLKVAGRPAGRLNKVRHVSSGVRWREHPRLGGQRPGSNFFTKKENLAKRRGQARRRC